MVFVAWVLNKFFTETRGINQKQQNGTCFMYNMQRRVVSLYCCRCFGLWSRLPPRMRHEVKVSSMLGIIILFFLLSQVCCNRGCFFIIFFSKKSCPYCRQQITSIIPLFIEFSEDDDNDDYECDDDQNDNHDPEQRPDQDLIHLNNQQTSGTIRVVLIPLRFNPNLNRVIVKLHRHLDLQYVSIRQLELSAHTPECTTLVPFPYPYNPILNQIKAKLHRDLDFQCVSIRIFPRISHPTR